MSFASGCFPVASCFPYSSVLWDGFCTRTFRPEFWEMFHQSQSRAHVGSRMPVESECTRCSFSPRADQGGLGRWLTHHSALQQADCTPARAQVSWGLGPVSQGTLFLRMFSWFPWTPTCATEGATWVPRISEGHAFPLQQQQVLHGTEEGRGSILASGEGAGSASPSALGLEAESHEVSSLFADDTAPAHSTAWP